jgi:prevent-host-death family protein
MPEVTIRELRNDGGRVLERVARGETLVVTRDGHPIAELRPLPRRPLAAAQLRARWRRLPVLDPVALKRDIDAAMDSSL